MNTLVHETVNAIETLNRNSYATAANPDERPTAPWVIGAIAEVMVK